MTDLEKLMLVQTRCACAVIKAISVMVERNSDGNGLDRTGGVQVMEIQNQLLHDVKEVMAA